MNREHPDSGRIVTSGDVINDLHDEIAQLRGTRKVLWNLLGECLPVIDALMQIPGDDDSDAHLNGLAGRINDARITELESQLAQRFDAADMATAAAQGFRDGATAPAQPVAAPATRQGGAYAALPDEGEPWRGHKFKEVQRGCWRCDCGKTIKEVTSDQCTPASGGNYPVMPKRYTVDDDGEELFTAEKMRAFADATHTLRASHGEAPAVAGMGHTDGGRNMFYEGRFDGESQREQQARLRWANDMRAAFERHTGNGWFDKDWRTETGLWSSAWHACLAAQPSPTAQSADSVQEDADRLKEVVGLLEELAEHDNYHAEYDGRMIAICPECGEQEGEHRPSCAFVRAKAYLAARAAKKEKP